MSVSIFAAHSSAHYATARLLFIEYASSLGVDLSFQGFADELQQLDSMYSAPGGCLLLAQHRLNTVGCVGVRALEHSDCEMKRLYVRDSMRGTGLGRTLAQRAIETAGHMGYKRMLLDTLVTMGAARGLYRALGFQEVEPYYRNPIAGTTFMALDLAIN